MHTAEPKSSTSNAPQRKSNAPFFQSEESREGLFGSKTAENPSFFPPAPALQAKCDTCEQEEKLQKKDEKEELKQEGIQPKLSIGAPDDPYEKQADAVADQVVQRLAAPPTPSTDPEEKLQRKEEEIDQAEEQVQMKPIFESAAPPDDNTVQRKCTACEQEEDAGIQRKESSGETSASTDISSRLQSSKGGGSALPSATKTRMESAMGADFSGVRVHTGSDAVQMSQDIHAQAFTHGSDVYFNAGKYNPGSGDGDRLLAHELVHTVQQGGGSPHKVQKKEIEGVKDPIENNFDPIVPVKKGLVIGENAQLLTDIIDGAEGIPIGAQRVLDLTHESKDKFWFFAENTSDLTRGYISQSQINVMGTPLPAKKGGTPEALPTEGKSADSGKKTSKVEGDKGDNKSTPPKENVDSNGLPSGTDNENKSPVSKTSESDLLQVNTVEPIPSDKVDIQAGISQLKLSAKKKKADASKFVYSQIAGIQKASSIEREKIRKVSQEKKETITVSYDKTILHIITESTNAHQKVTKEYTQQKARINEQKTIQLNALEQGTALRVSKLEEKGELVAKAAEKHGKDEEQRIILSQGVQKKYFDNLIVEEIKSYNVPDREERMRERLGALRDESMDIITESNVELIKQVKEDASDLAERLRDEYKEAAYDLPKEKFLIKQEIEIAASNGLEQIESIYLSPLDTMLQNALELATQLRKEKQYLITGIDEQKDKLVQEITIEEERRTQELLAGLSAYNDNLDTIIIDVATQAEDLPDLLIADLLKRTSGHITSTHAAFTKNVKEGAEGLTAVIQKASTEFTGNLETIGSNATKENDKTQAEFTKKADAISSTLIKNYVSIGDDVTSSMSNEVTEYFKALDITVAKSIEGLQKEFVQGKAEITAKVDEVLKKNQEIVFECTGEIKDEAEQLATEWEATYWLRRTGEAVMVLVGAVLWLVKWILIIIAVVIAIIIAIIFVIVIIEELIAVIANLLRRYFPRLLAFLERIIVRFVWPALKWLFRGLSNIIGRFLNSAFMRVVTFLFGIQGAVLLWEAMTRQDLPMSKRVKMAGEGIFLIGTSLLAEWKTIKASFELSKAYVEYRKIANILDDAKLAKLLINTLEGDLLIAMKVATEIKPAVIRSLLTKADAAVELKNTLQLFWSHLPQLESMLAKCETLAELNNIVAKVGNDVILAEKLLAKVGDVKELIALLNRVPDVKKLEALLELSLEIGKLSDEALAGFTKMHESEIILLKGKNIVELEEIGVNFSKGVTNPGDILAEFGIPKFYTYTNGGNSVFITPHAMKHLEELAANGSKLGPNYLKLLGQTYQKSLHSAIDDVLSRGPIIYRKMYFSAGNEIMFNAPRAAGELPAVIHFR